MNLYKSKLWISDIDDTLANFTEMERLGGKSVLITGCTGLICSAVTDLFLRWNETHEDKIRVYAAGRDVDKTAERFSTFRNDASFHPIPYDATSRSISWRCTCDYIIHGAGNASPNKIFREPVETMQTSFLGLTALLDYARDYSIKRVLYISSSEVYGRKENDNPYRPDEYGYIDLLNSRNSYSIGKRAGETLCISYSDEYGVDSVIVRPGHIYGPTATELDNRVSSLWAYAAARGEDIIMKSDGSQIRSYCYCLDCATAILKVLLSGESCKAYNISNPDSVVSIRKMAELFSESAGVALRLENPSEDEKRAFNPMKNSSLDASELCDLKWTGLFDVSEGVDHTVRILRECLGA